MDIITLLLFCTTLLICIIFDVSIVYALIIGFFIFIIYGKSKGFSFKELFKEALTGVKTVKNILITFVLIGSLTALWRAGGTIPFIVSYASKLITPDIFLLMTFLLNCMVSFLIGTSFGTAATMGVICATMGATMGISPVIVGGAVLSGTFWGDRCSPISTSALLVSELTKTDIYSNIKQMFRTSAAPTVMTCAVYFALGLSLENSGEVINLEALFGTEFNLHILTLLPAAVVLILAAFKVNVKKSMLLSIIVSIPVCLFIQNIPLGDIVKFMILGYTARNTELSSIINGGGITSMVRVIFIVCISSSYSGIFRKTGLLEGIKKIINKLYKHTNTFIATLLTSFIADMIACNQTLAVLLTYQLCDEIHNDNDKFAITLEDTVIITAPLIPWSIASGAPLTSIGAPTASIMFAFYLMILPLWRTVISLIKKDNKSNLAK